MPFLTDLDENSRIKGSRDPLGVVPLWSSFGRTIVGNLTTASNSVRGFTTLLIGLYGAEMVRERGNGKESEADTFLKFEQLAAYCRFALNKDDDFRGLRRVQANLNESPRVTISANQKDQILSNQKQYGLWGLFTNPAQLSALVERNGRRLMPEARAFVEQNYIAALGSGISRELIKLLSSDSTTINVERSEFCAAIAKIHGRLSRTEKAYYRETLAFGGKVDQTRGRQERLARAIARIDTNREFDFAAFRKVRAMTKNDDELNAMLRDIEHIELLITPVTSAFGFILTQRDQPVSYVADQIRKQWRDRGVSSVNVAALNGLRDRIVSAVGDSETADSWLTLATVLAAGDYTRLVQQLLAHNGLVMNRRDGSAAWVTIERGKLRVLIVEESNALLPASRLNQTWRSTYFINSLDRIVRAVELRA